MYGEYKKKIVHLSKFASNKKILSEVVAKILFFYVCTKHQKIFCCYFKVANKHRKYINFLENFFSNNKPRVKLFHIMNLVA